MISTEDQEPVDLEFAARPEYLADVRKAVERVAADTSLNREQTDDFLTAVDEAVANAIRHGSPQRDLNRVRVVCRRTPDALVVEVEDEGRGFSVSSNPTMPGPDAMGGRGLPLMCALADTMQVASTPQGTRVKLKKYIKRD